MKKSKLVKNLISFGVAIAVIALIAIYTKPKLPAPENLTATVLLSSFASEQEFTTQFNLVPKGPAFETAYRVLVAPEKEKTLEIIFDMVTGKISTLKLGNRKLTPTVLKNFQVGVKDGQIVVKGKLPTIISANFANAEVRVNAVNPERRNMNVSRTATTRIEVRSVTVPVQQIDASSPTEAGAIDGTAAPKGGDTGGVLR